MAWDSTIPAAKTALAALLDPVVDITVRNGVSVGATSDRDALTIGYQTEDTPAVEGQFNPEGSTPSIWIDGYVIHCRIAVGKGSTDISRAEARAFTLLATVGQTVINNPTLNTPGVTAASLGSYSLLPAQTHGGGFVTLLFDVEVEAYTTV